MLVSRRKRKKREGEVNCTCTAYPHVHRMMGGQCGGGGFVERFFEEQLGGECRNCNFKDDNGYECQVVQGLEPAVKCPGLEEFIRYNGIKLYGVNREK